MQIKLSTSWLRFFGVLTALQLSGCGFSPLYVDDNCDVREELHSIRIDVISDRAGQELRNYLIDTMTPKGTVQPVKYRLRVDISEIKHKASFRKDSTARHAELVINSKFRLFDTASDEKVLEGKVRKIAPYFMGSEAAQGSFSANVSEHTSRRRALKVLAESIKLRVASFIRQQRLKDEA